MDGSLITAILAPRRGEGGGEKRRITAILVREDLVAVRKNESRYGCRGMGIRLLGGGSISCKRRGLGYEEARGGREEGI